MSGLAGGKGKAPATIVLGWWCREDGNEDGEETKGGGLAGGREKRAREEAGTHAGGNECGGKDRGVPANQGWI